MPNEESRQPRKKGADIKKMVVSRTKNLKNFFCNKSTVNEFKFKIINIYKKMIKPIIDDDIIEDVLWLYEIKEIFLPMLE